MFLFSGIFFPFDQLPGWVEVVAWFTPLYHLVEIDARDGHRAQRPSRSSSTPSWLGR